MTNHFECKIRYEKTADNGLTKKVTEPYLVEALSFTEAEARLLEQMEPYLGGQEYEIADIKKAKISELVDSDDSTDDCWFRARIAFLSLDEKSGTEKRTAHTMLVKASDFRKALKNLDQAMTGMLADWLIVSITETAIVDYFPYKASDDK